MISKGSQRGGGQDLATHLLNAFDNERVEVADVRGTIAQDLHGAMAEWYAASKATRCRKYIYSLSVNPDGRQRHLTKEQYIDFIERVERKLGLDGQARVLVFHVKKGREHCHVAWSRIDTDKCRAVQISHDWQKLRHVARGFAKDYGLELPDGMKADRGAKRFKDKGMNLAEAQQQERTGITPAQRKAEITKAWRETKDGKSFIAALDKAGYRIARGERLVVVDRHGEVHGLARQIEGARTREIEERVGDVPALEKVKGTTPAPEQTAAQRRDDLSARHQIRRRALESKRDELTRQHRAEREALAEAQRAEISGVASDRLSKRQGLLAFLARITGLRAFMHRKQDARLEAEHREQTDSLARRHTRETRDFSRHERALARVEHRELRSLKRLLKLEQRLEPTPQKTPAGLAAALRRRANSRTRDNDPGRER